MIHNHHLSVALLSCKDTPPQRTVQVCLSLVHQKDRMWCLRVCMWVSVCVWVFAHKHIRMCACVCVLRRHTQNVMAVSSTETALLLNHIHPLDSGLLYFQLCPNTTHVPGHVVFPAMTSMTDPCLAHEPDCHHRSVSVRLPALLHRSWPLTPWHQWSSILSPLSPHKGQKVANVSMGGHTQGFDMKQDHRWRSWWDSTDEPLLLLSHLKVCVMVLWSRWGSLCKICMRMLHVKMHRRGAVHDHILSCWPTQCMEAWGPGVSFPSAGRYHTTGFQRHRQWSKTCRRTVRSYTAYSPPKNPLSHPTLLIPNRHNHHQHTKMGQ